MGKKRGITRAFLGVAASNDISHNPVVPGGASVAVSWTFLTGIFLFAEMVGTCLEPTLWSDETHDKEGTTAWCERGDQEQLTQCALPPSPKDTVFTQVKRPRIFYTGDFFDNFRVCIFHRLLV